MCHHLSNLNVSKIINSGVVTETLHCSRPQSPAMSFIIFLQQHALSVLFLTYCIHWFTFGVMIWRCTYVIVWSHILTVQSELQEMNTFGWKWFHFTASTDRLCALYVIRNWLEYDLEHCKRTHRPGLYSSGRSVYTLTLSLTYITFSMQTKCQYATRELISATEKLRFCLFASG